MVRPNAIQLIMRLNFHFSNWLSIIVSAASVSLAVLPANVAAFPAPVWMQGGHAARITGVACSSDGSLIVSSSEDGTVKLWSTNGALLRTLTAQPCPITALALSPDGTKIAAGGYVSGAAGMGLTYLWQAPGGWAAPNVSLVRVTTNRYGYVGALAFTPGSTQLASGCNNGSNIVSSVASGSVVVTCPAYNTTVRPGAVTSVAFSSGGMMASGCEDSTIRVYGSSWNLLWTSINAVSAHTTNVTAVAFSPDGSLLASASLDQTVKIWSTATWTLQQTLTGHTNGVASVAFSPNGQEIVSGSVDGTLRIWNRSSGACLLTVVAHALPVTATVFTPDGTRVVSSGDDGTVRIWSATTGSAVLTLGGQGDFIGVVAFSPDGALCASTGGDGTIQVRNTGDGSLVSTWPGNTNYVSSLAFSPDSARLASGGGPLDPAIKVWQISDGTLLQTIPATTNGVMALAWSPDGGTLAAGGDSVEQNITFWSTNGILQGTLPGSLSWHTNGVTALAFSPQGNLLASGGRRPGNMVRVWTNNAPGIWTSGTVARTYLSTATNNNVECVAFSPDGTLVGFGRTAVNVLKIGLPNGSDLTLGSGTNPVFSVAFSPDGRACAATDQNSINIWTNNGPSTWVLCETITNEAVRASRLAYSPNGNLLLCGREDGTLTMSPNTRGALGQPKLTFTSFKVDATGTATMRAAAQPLTHYIIQASTNLQDWSFLSSAVSSSNALTISGLSTSNEPARFHRATTPP
jgi:WD40 repeat protein